jgi:hypothetical protein
VTSEAPRLIETNLYDKGESCYELIRVVNWGLTVLFSLLTDINRISFRYKHCKCDFLGGKKSLKNQQIEKVRLFVKEESINRRGHIKAEGISPQSLTKLIDFQLYDLFSTS